MSQDNFVNQYVRLLNTEISQAREVLEVKDFACLADFNKVQGRLAGLTEALQLLKSVPEDD